MRRVKALSTGLSKLCKWWQMYWLTGKYYFLQYNDQSFCTHPVSTWTLYFLYSKYFCSYHKAYKCDYKTFIFTTEETHSDVWKQTYFKTCEAAASQKYPGDVLAFIFSATTEDQLCILTKFFFFLFITMSFIFWSRSCVQNCNVSNKK